MNRREFLATSALLPLTQTDGLVPGGKLQELILPQDLTAALAWHCGLPLDQRVIGAETAAQIADQIDTKSEAVFLYATDRDEDDYVLWSWFKTQKRWKQLLTVGQIARAGEFQIVRREHLFVLQTKRCQIPPFRRPERTLIVDQDDDWWWPFLGSGVPSLLNGQILRMPRQDWKLLVMEVFGIAAHPDFFEDDVLKGEITRQLSERLRKNDVDPDPWPGIGYGWREIADWLAQGECLFVPFPNQPMI